MDPNLKERLTLLSESSLLDMVENKSGEFTPEALELINAEVARRGGMEVLKEIAQRSANPPPSRAELIRRRRLLVVTVIAACGLFIFAVNGSFWFYWVCLFALIAGWFAVLLLPPHNPEDEIRELLSTAQPESGITTESSTQEGDEAN